MQVFYIHLMEKENYTFTIFPRVISVVLPVLHTLYENAELEAEIAH